jgi:hypothetical protein
MKFLDFLNEDYCCLMGNVEIYVNPTSDDFKSNIKGRRSRLKIDPPGGKEFRFVADCRTEKLFIWDSYMANHYEVIKYLIQKRFISKEYITLRNYYYISLDLISGLAELQGKKLIMFDSDELYDNTDDMEVRDKLLTREWGWMKRYMNIDELIDLQKEVSRR